MTVWLHCTSSENADAIVKNGFSILKNTQCRFGRGIYLSTERWYEDDQDYEWAVLECTVALPRDTIMEVFPPSDSFPDEGYTERHFSRWLNENKKVPSNYIKLESANSSQNIGITNFMLERGYKAAKFMEHGKEVLVVYDLSVITGIKLRVP